MKYWIVFTFFALGLISECNAAFYRNFGGWEEIREWADLVVVAKIKKPITSKGAIGYGVHRKFLIEIEHIIEGKIQETKVIARLADRRPTHDPQRPDEGREGDETMFQSRYDLGNAFNVDGRFLIFLRTPIGEDLDYQWDEIPIEGSTLPVNESFDLAHLKGKHWKEAIRILLTNFVDLKRHVFEHLEAHSEDSGLIEYRQKEFRFIERYTKIVLQPVKKPNKQTQPTASKPVVDLEE